MLDAPIEVTGFAWDEIDTILMEEDLSALEKGPLAPDPGAVATARIGDVFRMGAHRVICGDARDPGNLTRLFLEI